MALLTLMFVLEAFVSVFVSATAIMDQPWIKSCDDNLEKSHYRHIQYDGHHFTNDSRAVRGIVNPMLYNQYISNIEVHGDVLDKIQNYFGQEYVARHRGEDVVPTLMVIGSGTSEETHNMFDPVISGKWRVMLFEIIPTFIEMLSDSIASLAANVRANVHLYPCGVGPEDVVLQEKYDYHGIEATGVVRVAPVDNILKHRVAFANVDIDGNWPGFAPGARRVFKEGLIPVILWEAAIVTTTDKLASALEMYTEHYYVFDTMFICRTERDWEIPGFTRELNYVFPPDERPAEPSLYWKHFEHLTNIKGCTVGWTHFIGIHHDYLTTEHLDFLQSLGCGDYCLSRELVTKPELKKMYYEVLADKT